ncbi:MAG: hypothetical protein E7356_00595 [Clostridiales bacterium]|nr:hypothetical protein [Clostridiales bacterium]
MAKNVRTDKPKHYRKAWFRGLKKIMRIFIKKSKFVFLGEELGDRGIILSNHVGTSAPLAFELYGPCKNIRFWGAYEMNSNIFTLYKYQTRVYYHEKKHWNLFAARLFCLLATPLTFIFYRGLRLIPVYRGGKLRTTLNESLAALEDNQNIIIFPEDSSKGYLDELEGFHAGFTLLCNMCQKKDMDVPIYVAYYQKSTRTYVIDKPIMLSELFSKGLTKEEISQQLCDRCNELGKLSFEQEEELVESEKGI